VARLSREPSDNAVMRTNCVATMLGGGHAPNALPQAAHATVNCRILPGHSLQEVREQLVRVINDPQVSVRFVTYQGKVTDKDPGYTSFAPPPLKPEVMKPLDRVVAAMWPGIPVFPSMDAGASDAIYTNAAGMPTYGISGIAIDVDDVRAHGRDERPVITEQEPKSVSRETTFERDLHPRRDRDALSRILLVLCESLSADLRRKGYAGRTIGLKLRYDDFRTVTRDHTLEHATDDAQAIRNAARTCLKRVALDRRLRLLGVRAGSLVRAGEQGQAESPRRSSEEEEAGRSLRLFD
jgi:hypothetical protein